MCIMYHKSVVMIVCIMTIEVRLCTSFHYSYVLYEPYISDFDKSVTQVVNSRWVRLYSRCI